MVHENKIFCFLFHYFNLEEESASIDILNITIQYCFDLTQN